MNKLPISKRESLIAELAVDLYSLENIQREIVEYTKEADEEVWRRICLEMENCGFNVGLRADELKITPHVFDDKMIQLYSESDGFIYETLVESRNPFRSQKWIAIVNFILENMRGEPSTNHVLLYGDSVGSDSIFLSKLGFNVHYQDFDSYCSRFAKHRFEERGLTIESFDGSKKKPFDFVICLEVAEHVPDPQKLIDELAFLTDSSGFCIFSEAFGLVTPSFPTHLASNLEYEGKTVNLFKKAEMNLCWKDIDEKPLIFTKDPSRHQPSSQILRDLSRKFRKRVQGLLNSY